MFSTKLTQISIALSFLFGAAGCSQFTPVERVQQTQQLAPVMESQIISFDQSIPAGVSAGEGSTITLSDDRYILGEHSLKWDWTSGSTLLVNEPIRLITDTEAGQAWGRRATQVLSFWVYNETPVDDYMVVDLGRGLGGKATGDAGFKVNMNFTGWRTIGVSLQNDIQGREVEGVSITDSAQGEGAGGEAILGGPRSDMDSIRFLAPSSVESGAFYIDRIMLSVDDARYQWSDDQVKTRIVIPEIDFGLPAEIPTATSEELLAAQEVSDSLTQVFVEARNLRGYADLRSVDNIREKYQELSINIDDEGHITGRHIITRPQKVIYQPQFMKASDKELFEEYVDIDDYASLMLNVARYRLLADSETEKQELEQMYVNMTLHMMDQGFVHGSSLVTTHHWGYGSRWWYISAMLMSDVLAEQELQQPIFDALLWYSREFKANFDMIAGPESSDLDYFNTLSLQHLALILLEPNEDRKVALLKKFGNYINIALSQTPPGGYDGLRPDGTAWRHEGNYPGYSFPAFTNAAQLVYILDGTPFSVSNTGRAALKKAMLSAWVYSNPQVGIGLSGRHPFNPPELRHMSESYRWLAMSGNPETDAPVDHQLAAAYLQMTQQSTADSTELFGEKVEAATLPQGFWAFNGGAFGIHRYHDKMVTMKGYNSNVWSSEIYYRDNRYGRYQSHGAVQVVPYGKQQAIGFVEEGWDWNRNPGATTIHLPLEELDSPNSHTLMLRGNQPFSGASHIDGKYGMFGFKFDAPSMAKFDSSFTSRKTTFATDDRIVMLGTDISKSSSPYHVETTLFQHAITEQASDIWINGVKIDAPSFEQQLGQGDWLIDGQSNGYLMVSDSLVEVRRQQQESAHNKTRAVTKGHFASAWIDHGNNPSSDAYEYLLVLEATPEKMKALASDLQSEVKPYRVIQADRNAHVTYDAKTQTTGYVAFESTSFDKQLVKSIAQPAIIMTRVINDDEVVVSGVTPDLNMTRYTEAKPTAVRIEIEGLWDAKIANDKVTVSHSGNTTRLSFESYFGIPQQVTLQKTK
ncbi:chondroitinase family polysaccharide lyase [Vibrio nomapromontoriensis]|uniref:chondroitinase family polysaccharide lyase n=1 Tax=Vibrio nomapromontoriensis TaxID=2910246 RepID=UPI003D105939